MAKRIIRASQNITTMKIFYLIILSVFCLQTFGQSEKELKKIEKKAAKDSITQQKVAQGKTIISPLIMPAYTPEMGGLIAVGGIISFKTNAEDDLIQRSSFPITFGLSTTGATVFSGKLASYWFEDKLRINGDFWFKSMADNYWGVGYENGYNVQASDSTTAFNRDWWWFNPRFLFKTVDNLYVGLNIDYNYTKGSEATQQVMDDPYYSKYNDQPMNSGLGLILQYDTRDVPVNAWEGIYANADFTHYSSSLGGDNNYSILHIDVRNYINAGRVGSTFAWQARGRFGFGDVPYGEMSQLGTPFDLRGYTWGRYRDESMAFLIAEYRHQFSNPDGTLKKSGMVAWVAGGAVFGVDNNSATNNKILPNFGVGYRFEMQPRMNMRIDFGLGRETAGIYFNFNEAF